MDDAFNFQKQMQFIAANYKLPAMGWILLAADMHLIEKDFTDTDMQGTLTTYRALLDKYAKYPEHKKQIQARINEISSMLQKK